MIYFCIPVIVIIILAVLIARRGDNKFEEELNKTEIIKDPRELIKLGYKPLQNVAMSSESLRDPRPGAVIADYKSRGWRVILCTEALDDIYGRKIKDGNICSLWGKVDMQVSKEESLVSSQQT